MVPYISQLGAVRVIGGRFVGGDAAVAAAVDSLDATAAGAASSSSGMSLPLPLSLFSLLSPDFAPRKDLNDRLVARLVLLQNLATGWKSHFNTFTTGANATSAAWTTE